MKKQLTLALLILSTGAFGQSLTRKLILADTTKDSLYLKSGRVAFDRNGNYCFVIKKDKQAHFVTNTDTISGFKSVGSTYGKNGTISYTSAYEDSPGKPFYYKNAEGTRVYGTAVGKIEDYQSSNTKENMAIVTSLNDSVYYYINGKLLLQTHKEPKKYYGSADWISFSENGNTIYTLNRDSIYRLYVNGKQIDSSNFGYTQLAINNNGQYIYAQGNKPVKPIGKYDYRFYIHSMNNVLEFVRTVWNYELKENGAYYYSGDDNGPSYMAVNDNMHKGIKPVSNITLIDPKNYLYTFGEDGVQKINVNDQIYTYDFEEIFYPTLDKTGNFACYGMKDYYLYKFINGKKEEKPISNYGVRATPLYISPKGESVHFFKTDDSIYVYRDETLLFKPVSKALNFKVRSHKDFLQDDYVSGKSRNGQSLFYLQLDKQAYLVFNGHFSEPILPIMDKDYSVEEDLPGTIAAGEFTDNGFFAVQKTGRKKYQIIVNNTIYQDLDGIDYLISDSYFFDGKELIFYAVEGLSFYQIRLSL